jgi:hypothetical protein
MSWSENKGLLLIRSQIQDLNLVVDAIPGTWSDENPKKYEPTSVMDYVMKRFAAAY